MHARWAQVGEEAKLLAKPENRLLGALRARQAVVARVAHRAEENRIGFFGERERRRGQWIAASLVTRAAHRRLVHFEAQLELGEHLARLPNDLRPDAVTGQDRDLHLRSTRETARAADSRTRGSCPRGEA